MAAVLAVEANEGRPDQPSDVPRVPFADPRDSAAGAAWPIAAMDTGGDAAGGPCGGVVAARAPRELEETALREYGEGLGVHFVVDADLRWLVHEAFNAPLPTSWYEYTDEEGRLFFFRAASGESSWEHPMDQVYRDLVSVIKQARLEQPHADQTDTGLFIRNHLMQVHQRAMVALEGWSGPYSSEEGEYYYNEITKLSTWECPLTEWEHELAVRHWVLCRCLLPERTVVGADGNVEMAADNSGGDCSDTDLLQALRLPLELVRRADPTVDQPSTPSTSRTYYTARSIYSIRSSRSGDKQAHQDRKAKNSPPSHDMSSS